MMTPEERNWNVARGNLRYVVVVRELHKDGNTTKDIYVHGPYYSHDRAAEQAERATLANPEKFVAGVYELQTGEVKKKPYA